MSTKFFLVFRATCACVFIKRTIAFILICLISCNQFSHASITDANPVVLIVGTRPEAIKMAPIYEKLKKENIPVLLCSTGQHAELLDSALDIFKLKVDYNLKIMSPGQDLFHVTQAVLEKTKKLFEAIQPALVVVQGDTTSAMSAALAAFYLKIPVAHVEAGLRTGNMHAPFPEELNRRFISLLAAYHFTPTQLASSNLMAEGVNENAIFCTGNTVVDALYEIKEKIENKELIPSECLRTLVEKLKQSGQRLLLLTVHRRESFETGIKQIFSSIKRALYRYPNLHVVYPQHPNPAIKTILQESGLHADANISIFSALSYVDMVYLLLNADAVATDSGGIQEEAVSLNKPVFILRNETDRPEGVIAGKALLVGTNELDILNAIDRLMNGRSFNEDDLAVYGDGNAAERIARIIKNTFSSGK